MTTAIQLNAADSLGSGHGLQVSANLLAQLSTFQNHQPIKTIANIYATASTANANVAGNLGAALSSVGAGVNYGRWLIDFYPANVTPVCSTGVGVYGGNVSTASMSRTISNQANAPFIYGVDGFANAYSRVSSYTMSVFETVASINLLKNKTYAQSGLNYTGPLDLATGGVGNTNIILANAVANWGTMYDINNMRYMGDPYVFGQNLLNQGLGTYGDLAIKLADVGLNIDNLSLIPPSQTSTSQKISDLTYSTSIGAIVYPTTSNVTTTTTVTGSSPGVVIEIYRSVTGANLTAIQQATGITTTKPISNLAEYLELFNVIDDDTITQLTSMNIGNLSTFGTHIQSKVGRGSFADWEDVSTLLKSLEVPELQHISANANDLVVSTTITSGLLNRYGTGTGPFDTLTIIDCLGAVAGMPYTPLIETLNTSYDEIVPGSLQPALSSLDSAVVTYVAAGELFMSNANIYGPPDIGPVSSAVDAVNASLMLVSNTVEVVNTCESAVYSMLDHLSREVIGCQKATINFNSAPPAGMAYSFGENIGTAASNKTTKKTYQFFANLITNDYAGDTIKLAVAEAINTSELSKVGITLRNDPQPMITLGRSTQLNMPLTTYLSRNK